MNELSLTGQDGQPIADWRSWTRPKAAYHWRAGRSAMELARAWFTSPVPVCPPEVESILESHPATAGVAWTEGWPEYVTPLPERGEGRNHDLLLVGCRDGCGVVVSVEAKVDEPFGERIGDYWLRARESNRRTRVPERIEALVSMVFGSGTRPDAKPWSLLRYQLLTAVAGTAIEAAHRKSDTAVTGGLHRRAAPHPLTYLAFVDGVSPISLARVFKMPPNLATPYVLSSSRRQTASSMKPSGSSQNVA